jgi:nucleoside-diphosphate-sugar epimerase
LIAITGAGGFVGSALCRGFESRGWQVRAGVRKPSHYQGPGRPFVCDLPDELDEAALQGCEVVIHAAWEMRFRDARRARKTNIEGSRRVLQAARDSGARVVFISSCSAHPAARSRYGRSKLEVERLLDSVRDLSLRPGLVVGTGGLFARMVEGVRRSPIIPLFDGGKQIVQTVGIEELVEATARAIDAEMRGRLVVAHPGGIRFGEMMSLIAQQLDKSRFFLPITATPFLWAAQVGEKLRIPLPFSSENLLGLRGMIAQHSAESDLTRLGMTLERPESLLRRAVKEFSGRL